MLEKYIDYLKQYVQDSKKNTEENMYTLDNYLILM